MQPRNAKPADTATRPALPRSRQLRLDLLHTFEAAARHLSFPNAASELNVTQTAISHQIRRLEQELGIRLFIRQNRALALTPLNFTLMIAANPDTAAWARSIAGVAWAAAIGAGLAVALTLLYAAG